MTILNPKIEDGYVTGTAFDMYNFEKMAGENFKDVPKEIKDINNSAYFLQSVGKLRNYYMLIPIKIKF